MQLRYELDHLNIISEEEADPLGGDGDLDENIKDDFLGEVVCWDSKGAVIFSSLSCSDDLIERFRVAGEGQYYTRDNALSMFASGNNVQVSTIHFGDVPEGLKTTHKGVFEMVVLVLNR